MSGKSYIAHGDYLLGNVCKIRKSWQLDPAFTLPQTQNLIELATVYDTSLLKWSSTYMCTPTCPC